MKKVEIVTWYKCNCVCSFCTSPGMSGNGFTTNEIVALLSKYRKMGATAVDFGGGEPTVREDLPILAEAAAALGYASIGVKSNGVRFCYPDYAQTCINSGINNFSISLWGYPAAMHDQMAGKKGAFEMTEMGLKHLVDFGADVRVDYLITTHSLPTLGNALKHLSGKVGVRKFSLWLFSVFGAGGTGMDILPPLAQTGKVAVEAWRAVRGNVEWVKTSHIPPCLLKGNRSMYCNVRDLDLLVVTPGHSFKGEDSPFEKGTYVSSCAACRMKSKCSGPREEYVRIMGEAGITPIK